MLTYAEYAPLANVLPPSHKRFFRRITGFNNLSSEFRTEYELEDDPRGSSFCDAGGGLVKCDVCGLLSKSAA